MKKLSNILSIDELCNLLDVSKASDVIDCILECSSTYGYVYTEALDAGSTEEKAEELAQEAESDELGEYWEKYENAVVSIADSLFSKHNLTLTRINSKKNGITYKVMPVNNWRNSADCIRETINGVGYFHFDSLKELLTSGPYTPKEAVLEHLDWIKYYPSVYGDTSVKTRLDRAMR